MNQNILNGNKILGTAKVTNVPLSFDVFENVPTHFYTDDETIARAKKEYLLALNDDLNETETRIIENRLQELNAGLVNLWIAERYGEKKAVPSKTVEPKQVKTNIPAIDKLLNQTSGHISNVDWIDGGLVVLFYRHPEKASEFVKKLPLGLKTYCRADTGYVRIDFPVQQDSAVDTAMPAKTVVRPFELTRKSQDELIGTVLNFWPFSDSSPLFSVALDKEKRRGAAL